MSSYDSYSLLGNIEKERISFILKNPLNIMLIQKYEEEKSENDHFQNECTDKNGYIFLMIKLITIIN